MFRELTLEEEAEFREHARDTFKPENGDEINPVWHPIYRDECEKMIKEMGVS